MTEQFVAFVESLLPRLADSGRIAWQNDGWISVELVFWNLTVRLRVETLVHFGSKKTDKVTASFVANGRDLRVWGVVYLRSECTEDELRIARIHPKPFKDLLKEAVCQLLEESQTPITNLQKVLESLN